MNIELKKKGQSLFLQATELQFTEQVSFIKRSCQGDSRLEEYALELLKSHQQSDEYFEKLENSITSTHLNEIEDHLYRDIDFGNYQILNVLKQGGMGTIFLAKRSDGEFERDVVIKMIPIDLTTPQSQNQFAHEKAVLASLVHPHIVQLYDSGITDSGQSYFVMELVRGKTLINYCNHLHLNLNQRIKLFNGVLSAIEFAHQHLVIHGDIKPSNIMVNSDGQIKLLDFGIAKLINKNNSHSEGYSLNYLTPEHKNKQPIITTTDIHQLGQLLFELLTDISPKKIRGNDFNFPLLSSLLHNDSVIKQIKKQTRLSKKSIANSYNSDLQYILQKSLAFNSKNRYQAIQKFSEDLDLLKKKYPVSAKFSTPIYRLKKYLIRNVLITASLATVLLFLIIFTFITIKNNQQLTKERDKALTVKNLITDIFNSADPTINPGKELSATQVLDNGINRIRKRFITHSDIEVELLQEVAKTYQNLGKYHKAKQVLNEAHDINSKLHPDDDLLKAHSMLLLGENSRLMSDNKIALNWLQQSLAIYSLYQPKYIKQMASVKSKLGRVMVLLGDFSAAESVLQNATDITKNIYGKESLEYAQALNSLNSAYFRQGKYKQVQKLLLETKQIRERILTKTNGFILNADYATNINNLGLAFYLYGDLTQGEKYFRQANLLREKIFTKPHPDQAQSLTNLGLLLNDAGKADQALPYLQKALAVREQTLSNGHMRINDAKNNLAMVYHENSNFKQADEIYSAILERVIEVRGKKHPQTLSIMTNRANTLMELQQFNLAQELFNKSLKHRLESLPKNHLYLSYSYIGLGRSHLSLGNIKEAITFIDMGLKIRKEKLPADSWLLGEALLAKSEVSFSLGKVDINQTIETCKILDKAKGKNSILAVKCSLLLERLLSKH